MRLICRQKNFKLKWQFFEWLDACNRKLKAERLQLIQKLVIKLKNRIDNYRKVMYNHKCVESNGAQI